MSTVTQSLRKVLTNSYVLYFKTHSYHWNVEGPHFHSFHEMFGEQYTEMWEAIDDLAERLRALGEYAPHNSSEMTKGAELVPAGQAKDAIAMVKDLAEDNATLSKIIHAAMEVAQDAGDEITTDMLIGRATMHEKNAWMLNASAK